MCRLLLPLLAVLLALGVAAPAHASSVSMGGGILYVDGGEGERNDLLVTYVSSGTYLVAERTPLTTLRRFSSQCVDHGGGVARCTGVSSIMVDAGDGADVVAFSGVSIATTLTDGPGDDRIAGGNGTNTFIGSPGDDKLTGGNGRDRFGDAGGDGADTLQGGGGTDTADYSGRWTPLTVTQDAVANDGAAGEGDDVRGDVEELIGGSGADRLTGGDGNQWLKGNGGDDVLDGRAGADRLQGDGGEDTADYRSRTVRVVVSADSAAGDGAGGENDTVMSDVDSILSGSGHDELTGNTWHGTLDGGAGNDTLRGGGGDDRVVGAAGDDDLVGGSGDDHLLGGDGRDDLDAGDDDDRLDGGAGPDAMHGGYGSDVVDYSARTVGLTVDVTTSSAGPSGEGDTIDGIDGAHGGSGNDRLYGDGDDGVWDGGAGNDLIDGRGGADRMAGGPGWDRVEYGTRRNDVTVWIDDSRNDGEDGERDDVRRDVEQVTTGSGDDRVGGDDSGEVLSTGAGDDQVWGNDGNDTVNGGDGRDVLYPGKGHDRASGGSGDDRLGGDAGNDTLDGGSGKDKVYGEDGDDHVIGGDHDDQITGGSGNDALDAGHGSDEAWGNGGDDRIIGGDGNDRAGGDDGNDHLDGGEGGDNLDGGRGNDFVTGAGGNDRVNGNDGDDALHGGDGDDKVWAGNGNDSLDGWGGDDEVGGGNGDDTVHGSSGNDTVNGDDGNDHLYGGDGNDRLNGGDDSDGLDAGAGDDRLSGGSGPDVLAGGPDTDKVWGDSGDDRLDGGDGNDELGGGNDDDVLVAGPGADRMTGDNGEDTADYGARIEPLRITNDDKADDGARGEGDNVTSSVDHFIGGHGNDLIRVRNSWSHKLYGEGGNDTLDGGPKIDMLVGGPGNDQLIGRDGKDLFDGGPGADKLSGYDGAAEVLRCGPGKDSATRDGADKGISCETVRRGSGKPSDPTENDTVPVTSNAGRLIGTKRVYSRGRFVAIPGSPGEKIDRRLLKDIAYLKSKYKIAITDGYALSGHARDGEHPIGLGLDVVPGAGGSWSDIDRLAKWAEPRRNRPRAPFRWVGYNGDSGHGRGHHLHLSWRHAKTKRGKPAKWVEVLSFKSGKPTVRAKNLIPLSGRSNKRLGGAPSVKTGKTSLPRCRGAKQLVGTWKAAGKAFGVNWRVLAAVTEIESGFGCNMGPSQAGELGWTKFTPTAWKTWGMDADGDGTASPYSSADAIFSTARQLRAAGAPKRYTKALRALNGSGTFAGDVLKRAKKFR